MTRPRIVLSSRELFPFGGGGIGTYVAETAQLLAPVADVTVVTASWHEDRYRELAAQGDPRVAYGGAEVAFVAVPEPADYGGFHAHMHLYGQRVLARVRELFGARGPELIELPDYLGEGFVATQAARAGDPFLASTVVVLRLHTTAEMIEVLNGHLPQELEGRISRDLERRALRDADVLLEAGGDILGTYARFYDGELAPARRVRHPMPWPGVLPARPTGDGPLRLLYVGRCERRKGVQDLLDALTSLPGDWQLTVLGDDTPTAPLGGS
ncbi:MAG TPA: glycosyltransferase, partial [Solirubrobacteraceae bacterium]